MKGKELLESIDFLQNLEINGDEEIEIKLDISAKGINVDFYVDDIFLRTLITLKLNSLDKQHLLCYYISVKRVGRKNIATPKRIKISNSVPNSAHKRENKKSWDSQKKLLTFIQQYSIIKSQRGSKQSKGSSTQNG